MTFSADNTIFGVQVAGAAYALYSASDMLLSNTGGPCYKPGAQGGFVEDPSRNLSLPTIAVLGASIAYTAVSLIGIIAHKAHRVYLQTQNRA
jgi:hypothetical protein